MSPEEPLRKERKKATCQPGERMAQQRSWYVQPVTVVRREQLWETDCSSVRLTETVPHARHWRRGCWTFLPRGPRIQDRGPGLGTQAGDLGPVRPMGATQRKPGRDRPTQTDCKDSAEKKKTKPDALGPPWARGTRHTGIEVTG